MCNVAFRYFRFCGAKVAGLRQKLVSALFRIVVNLIKSFRF